MNETEGNLKAQQKLKCLRSRQDTHFFFSYQLEPRPQKSPLVESKDIMLVKVEVEVKRVNAA